MKSSPMWDGWDFHRNWVFNRDVDGVIRMYMRRFGNGRWSCWQCVPDGCLLLLCEQSECPVAQLARASDSESEG